MGQVFADMRCLAVWICTPGIMIGTKVLVDKKGPELEREYAARHLECSHLCRCTGYVKILDAVEALAKGEIPEEKHSGHRKQTG